MATENLAPLQSDLLEEKNAVEVIRGLENIVREDIAIADGESFEEGDWAVVNSDYELEAPGATPKHNSVLVWAGNTIGRSDVAATGKATVLRRTRPFIYRTTKFNTGLSYVAGDALTAKDLGGGEKTLTKAGGTEAVLARVSKVVSDSELEVEVVTN